MHRLLAQKHEKSMGNHISDTNSFVMINVKNACVC